MNLNILLAAGVSARDRSSGAPLGDAQAEVVIFSLERPALFEIGLKAKK